MGRTRILFHLRLPLGRPPGGVPSGAYRGYLQPRLQSADQAGDKKSPRPKEAAKGFRTGTRSKPRKFKRSSATSNFWTALVAGKLAPKEMRTSPRTLRPCYADSHSSRRIPNAEGSKDVRRTISRHAQGHLLRGEKDFDRFAQDGHGGAEPWLEGRVRKAWDRNSWAGRLEQVFGILENKPQGKKCPAIDGIIQEGQEIAKEYKDSPVLDSGLLAAAQAVEHYEISRYGTLRTWARELGLSEAVRQLETTLKEEDKDGWGFDRIGGDLLQSGSKIGSR
jgi:Domain of unknown function (DUF892)